MWTPGRGTRLWRGALAGLVIAALSAPVSAAARQAVPAPAPAMLPVVAEPKTKPPVWVQSNATACAGVE